MLLKAIIFILFFSHKLSPSFLMAGTTEKECGERFDVKPVICRLGTRRQRRLFASKAIVIVAFIRRHWEKLRPPPCAGTFCLNGA